MKLLLLVTTATFISIAASNFGDDLQARDRAGETPAIAIVFGIQAAQEVPWTPTDTGTVRPGMTRDEVVAVWGAPMTERTIGVWTYMYYRNGCERSCGIHDVVFLENGQVVNAIVRGRGHTYAGMSSSPSGQTPQFTPRRRTPMEQ